MLKKIIFIRFLFLILFIVPVFGNEIIHIEVWTELDPIDFSDADAAMPLTSEESKTGLTILWKENALPALEDISLNPISQETAFRNLLSEAKILISAMIYGFTFSYIPADKQRGVKEFFEVLPIAEIPFGDKNLTIDSTELTDSRIYVRMTYFLDEHQLKRRESWRSMNISSGTGSGDGSLLKGIQEKQTALDMSLKNAVKNSLNTRILNKPREIKGEAVLEKNPHTIIRAGTYTTTARFKILIKEIITYKVF